MRKRCARINRRKDTFGIENMNEGVTSLDYIAASNFPRNKRVAREKSNITFLDTLLNWITLAYVAPHVVPPRKIQFSWERNEPLSNIVVTRRNARCGSPFRHLQWNFWRTLTYISASTHSQCYDIITRPSWVRKHAVDLIYINAKSMLI